MGRSWITELGVGSYLRFIYGIWWSYFSHIWGWLTLQIYDTWPRGGCYFFSSDPRVLVSSISSAFLNVQCQAGHCDNLLCTKR
jgi:hypothetical protein